MPITAGAIEYERRLNLGEYNHKHVVAKVLWSVEEGEDDDVLAAFAIDKAVMRVRDVLNWKPANPAQSEPEPKPEPELFDIAAERIKSQRHIEPNIETQAAPNLATQHAAAEITAGIPPALKRHRRTKAEMDAARAAEIAVADRHDETAVVEPGMPSFDPDPEPPAEVTDQALLDACQAKASSGKPVADIKELVAKFSPGGLVQTPQDTRRRFLDDLAKL